MRVVMLYTMDKETISVVIPVKNESLNLPILYRRLRDVLVRLGYEFELIFIDDGSSDNSFAVLTELGAEDPLVRVIHFRQNFGQTAALSAGIEAATGTMIILIDSDLENDPEDIAVIVKKLESGYDVVSGWRKDRWKDEFITRKIPSLVANSLISKIAGLKLNDYGCTLKGYRSDVIKNIPLYGEMHRFIPAYAHRIGARVAEIEVRYAPRIHGKSNYGISRIFKVLPDLLLLKFMEKYMSKPMHFFGLLGFIASGIGFLAIVAALYMRLFHGISLILTPLPTLAAMCVIVGAQFFVMGLVAEILMRTYYESQGKRPYMIKKTINLP